MFNQMPVWQMVLIGLAIGLVGGLVVFLLIKIPDWVAAARERRRRAQCDALKLKVEEAIEAVVARVIEAGKPLAIRACSKTSREMDVPFTAVPTAVTAVAKLMIADAFASGAPRLHVKQEELDTILAYRAVCDDQHWQRLLGWSGNRYGMRFEDSAVWVYTPTIDDDKWKAGKTYGVTARFRLDADMVQMFDLRRLLELVVAEDKEWTGILPYGDRKKLVRDIGFEERTERSVTVATLDAIYGTAG